MDGIVLEGGTGSVIDDRPSTLPVVNAAARHHSSRLITGEPLDFILKLDSLVLWRLQSLRIHQMETPTSFS